MFYIIVGCEWFVRPTSDKTCVYNFDICQFSYILQLQPPVAWRYTGILVKLKGRNEEDTK